MTVFSPVQPVPPVAATAAIYSPSLEEVTTLFERGNLVPVFRSQCRSRSCRVSLAARSAI